MNKIEMGLAVITSISIAGCCTIVYLNRKKKISKKQNIDNKNIEIKKNTKKKLIQIEDKYFSKFLSYAMFSECINNKLSTFVEQKIESIYGKNKSIPIIKFSEEFTSDEYNYLSEAIKEYLIEKNFLDESEKQADDKFEQYLLEKAKLQAKKEILKYKEQ